MNLEQLKYLLQPDSPYGILKYLDPESQSSLRTTCKSLAEKIPIPVVVLEKQCCFCGDIMQLHGPFIEGRDYYFHTRDDGEYSAEIRRYGYVWKCD
jgi:hypothetical protein